VQGFGVVVGGGEEEAEELEKFGVLRFADFFDAGRFSGEADSSVVVRRGGFDPAAGFRPDFVVGGELEGVTALRLQFVDFLGAGGEKRLRWCGFPARAGW